MGEGVFAESLPWGGGEENRGKTGRGRAAGRGAGRRPVLPWFWGKADDQARGPTADRGLAVGPPLC